jgi:hypothetical protein
MPTCRRRSASSSWASSWRDRAAQPAGQPGAGHGQDRVRPCAVAQHRHRHGAAAGTGRADHHRDVPRARCDRHAGVPPTPVVLRADPDRMTQVLLNLLSNAAKFVPAQDGRVAVVLTAAPDHLRVAVQDNGPGVPPATGPDLREVPPGRRRRLPAPGHGPGLPISRQIVEHFGGRLWIDAPRSGGARFVFELPTAPPRYPPMTCRRHPDHDTTQDSDRRRRAQHPDLARIPDAARRLRGARWRATARKPWTPSCATRPIWSCST